ILLILSIIFSLILIPALFIYEKIKYYQASSQHIYIVYVTIIVSFIATFIISTIILESYFYKMLEILDDFSYFYGKKGGQVFSLLHPFLYLNFVKKLLY